MDKLSGYAWPGNVRQLRNVVHRALVLASGSDEIGPEHIEF
jgi:DNA-binding NtrC family response regulator